MRTKTWLLVILCMAIFASAGAVSISCSPQPQIAAQSQSFTLAVNLDTQTQIRGYSIRVQYNPAVITFSQAARGTIFTGQNVGWWRSINESQGIYRIECIIFGYGLYVTGPGNLFNLTFTASALGYSGLDFLSIELYDPSGAIIPDVSGTSGAILIGSGFTYTSLRAFLQGPFSQGSMTTNLKNVLPLSSPYAQAPVTVTSLASDIVDWVLVELRTSPSGQAVRYLPALIHANGEITSPGKPYLMIENTTPQSYYVVLRHRNHLPIMSANPIPFISGGTPSAYDYSALSNIYGQGGVSRVAESTYAMSAGDADMDGGVYPADKNLYWKLQSGLSGYRSADFDLDGYVLPGDLNACWRINTGKACTVPGITPLLPRDYDE